MSLIFFFFLALFFLLACASLTSITCAFRKTPAKEGELLLRKSGNFFFYRKIHMLFFSVNIYDGIYFCLVCAENVTRFLFVASSIAFLMNTTIVVNYTASSTFWIALNVIGLILVSFLLGDYLPRILGTRLPDRALKVGGPLASLMMCLVIPITIPLLRTTHGFSRSLYFDLSQATDTPAKHEIMEILQDVDFGPTLEPNEKRLITSILNFRNRIAREIMVPRVNLFSLPNSTTIKEAAELIRQEGYSRVPVFEENVDKVVGVVMYKDILTTYMEYAANDNDEKIIEAPISVIQKPVLYTPETKKISPLLQDFKRAQSHMAIVVDEYGGTEGIVTIEDVLEELVGEIADEYDTDEDLFIPQPDGSWVVDARMNILDIEEELGIKIPQEGDYDTIGGFIAHTSGSIPAAGFTIHHDQFEMEIVSSNERSVEKVRIRAIPSSDSK